MKMKLMHAMHYSSMPRAKKIFLPRKKSLRSPLLSLQKARVVQSTIGPVIVHPLKAKKLPSEEEIIYSRDIASHVVKSSAGPVIVPTWRTNSKVCEKRQLVELSVGENLPALREDAFSEDLESIPLSQKCIKQD